MIYFFAGFVLGEVFARVNHLAVMVISVIAIVTIFFIINKFGQSRLWLVLSLFFYLGGLVINYACSDSEFERVWKENTYTEEYVSVTGIIEKLDSYEDSVRITLKSVNIGAGDKWYDCSNIFVYTDSVDEGLLPGNSIVAYGNISRLNNATNPGQFDAGKYYNALNIEYSLNAGYCEVSEYNSPNLCGSLHRLRVFLQSGLKLVTLAEDYEVLSAMLLGDKSELGEELEILYQLNGIAHILTISGLHISMLGRGLYKFLRKLGGGFIISSVIAGIVICMYGLMTGLGTSSLRAIIMFVVMLMADCLGKSYDMTSAVCFAGILVLLEYPLMIYQFAFQMSVICILAISMVAPTVCKFLCIENRFLQTIVTGCVIQWCTIPILLYHMYTYPVFSVLINLVVIPLVELVMISGFLCLLMSLINYNVATFMSGAAHYILLFYKTLCEFVSGFEYALLIPGRPEIWKLVLYYMILLVSMGYMTYKVSNDKRYLKGVACKEALKKLSDIAPWDRRNNISKNVKALKEERLSEKVQKESDKLSICIRYVFVVASMVVCVFILTISSRSKMTITFADVGQGDCTLIEMASGDTALIDCGSSNITDVSSGRIIPMLNYYGIKSLDYVFLSHADSDHISGMTELIEAEKVKNIILPDRPDNSGFIEIISLAKAYDIPVLYVNSGDKVSAGEVSFICLHPAENDNTEDENSSSMVLKLEYKEFSVLFTGDLDMTGESRVIEAALRYGISIDSDILKVGHHGSKYSTGEEFLRYVLPENSVISCSENNTYGHPSEEVLERLGSSMSDIYITKDSGAVIVKTNGRDYRIEAFCK